MKACPYCGEAYQDTAFVCLKCRHDFTNPPQRASIAVPRATKHAKVVRSTPKPQNPSKPILERCLQVIQENHIVQCLLGAVLIWGMIWLPKSESLDASKARRFAKDCVRASLIAPSTAKFFPLMVDGNDAIQSRVDGAWNVMGIVESQNGFGVPLQKKYLVLCHQKDGEWICDKVSFVD